MQLVKKINVLFLSILVVCVALRLINLNQSLWLDEAINVVYAQSTDFLFFVTKYPIGDFHPPGWFAILWVWGHLFGFSEISVRLPSVFFGVGTVFFTYLIGKKLFNRNIALVGSLLLAINGLHVYYSQEARMYSMAAFAVAMSFYFLTRLNNTFGKVGYAISLSLVIYTDYLAYFIIPAQIIILTFFKKTEQGSLKRNSFLFLFPLISFLIWFPVFIHQFSKGNITSELIPTWKAVVGGANMYNLGLTLIKFITGRVNLENNLLYLLIICVICAVFILLILKSLKNFNYGTKVLTAWLIVPAILSFLVSIFIPVFAYFRLIFLLPAFCLLLAKGVLSFQKNIRVIVLSFVILVELISLSIYYLSPNLQREDWRSAYKYLSNQDCNCIILFESSEVPAPFIYYNKDHLKAYPALWVYPTYSQDDLVNLGDITGNYKTVYLFEYYVEIADPNRLVEKRLNEIDFKKQEIINFPALGFLYKYSKE